MATTATTPTYLFPYPTGEDSLSNLAQRIQDLATRIETTYSLMGIDTSFTNLLQSGDAAGGSLTGTYPNPTIAANAINNSMIQDNAISTNDIQDSAITSAKIVSSINLNGSPTTTTQNTSDNSTKIATTAYVNTVAANFQAGYVAANSIVNAQINSAANIAYSKLDLSAYAGHTICTSSTRPSSPFNGMMIFETDTKQSWLYNGSSWVCVGHLDVWSFNSVGNVFQGTSATTNVPRINLTNTTADTTSANIIMQKSRSLGVVSSNDNIGAINFNIHDGTGYQNAAQILALADGASSAGSTPGALSFRTVANGTTTFQERMRISNAGLVSITAASFGRTITTRTSSFSVSTPDNWIVCNSSSTITVTLPDAASWYGREIMFKNINTGSVISASSNVVPIASSTAGTAILPVNTAGAYCTLVSDGTNWVTTSTLVSTNSLTDAGHLLVANTAARPSSPTVGTMIYQVDTGEFLKWTTDLDNTNRWMQIATGLNPNRNMLNNSGMNVCQRTGGFVRISNVALTANVATLTTNVPHGFRTGSIVNIVGAAAAPFNVFCGIFTIASTPSATTFTYTCNNSNVTSTAVTNANGYPYLSAIPLVQNITATNTGGAAPNTIINGYATVDRWKTTIASNPGTFMQSNDTMVPNNTPFTRCFKTQVTTTNTTLSGSQEARISQTIEGQNAQAIRRAWTNELPVTLSFWVRCTVTGTYIAELTDVKNGRSVSQAYTINSTNWEKKVIVFPVDSGSNTANAFIPNDSSAGLELSFWLAAGSTYTSGTLQTTWGTTTNANRAVGQTNLAGTSRLVSTTAASGTGAIASLTLTGFSVPVTSTFVVSGVTPAAYNGIYNYISVSGTGPFTLNYYSSGIGIQTVAGTVNDAAYHITGVQLEIGSAPSEVEVLKYEDELLRCQRYYYRITNYATTATTLAMGLSTTTTNNIATYTYPVNMRIAPTSVETSGTAADYGTTNGTGGQVANSAVPSFTNGTNKTAVLTTTVAAGLTAGQAGSTYFGGVVGAYLGFSADF